MAGRKGSLEVTGAPQTGGRRRRYEDDLADLDAKMTALKRYLNPKSKLNEEQRARVRRRWNDFQTGATIWTS